MVEHLYKDYSGIDISGLMGPVYKKELLVKPLGHMLPFYRGFLCIEVVLEILFADVYQLTRKNHCIKFYWEEWIFAGVLMRILQVNWMNHCIKKKMILRQVKLANADHWIIIHCETVVSSMKSFVFFFTNKLFWQWLVFGLAVSEVNYILIG